MLLFLMYCVLLFLFHFFFYYTFKMFVNYISHYKTSLGLFINITLGEKIWFCFYLDNVLYYYFILIFPYYSWNYCSYFLSYCYFVLFIVLFPVKGVYISIYKYTLLKYFPLNQDLDSSHRFCKVIFRHYSLLSLQLFWKWYLKKMYSNSLTMQFST